MTSSVIWLLLCLLWTGEVLSSSEVAVTATAGHNVTLPCRSLSFRFGVHSFCWGRGECPLTGQCGSNEIYKWDGRLHRMSDKYQLTGDIQRGDLSLTVVNVTMEDSGPYCCLIEILGPFNDERNSIRLTVTEASLSSDKMASSASPTPLQMRDLHLFTMCAVIAVFTVLTVVVILVLVSWKSTSSGRGMPAPVMDTRVTAGWPQAEEPSHRDI
ncbi:T-cell immunoglobulin and mucin domain-containing protein 4-like [Polypterus senegalus]|uniref:T-cell immunoglobulin and mucin domain-containing protein 4-like n=1 Tax=Polypterus senegalus TaxID=55291 RepID=UPI00196445B4|nr:T-cell immunoglobulin and mucin domain-containing protein 4-like [Polypterus senegalus]